MRQKEKKKEGGEGRVSVEMTIVASQGDSFLGDKVACQGNNLTEFTNDCDALMKQNESRKEGGEGKVSAEMIVASQGNDFLGDKVAFQGNNLTEFTNDGDALDIVACDAIQCNDSALAPIDMLRPLDKDTVRCKGTQTEKKDFHLPNEWVLPKPRGICEPVWAVVGDNDLPASKRTPEPVYTGAQEAESKKSLVDYPVVKRTRSSRTCKSVDGTKWPCNSAGGEEKDDEKSTTFYRSAPQDSQSDKDEIEADSDHDVGDPDYQEPKKSKGPPPGSMGPTRRNKRLKITR